MELLSNELSHSDDHGLLHLAPALNIADRSVKLLNTHPTMTNHHHGLGRSIFLKQTRHYYGHQYFRRNSTNHANASSSRAKEYREKVFSRPERIPSSSLGMDEMSSNNKAEMVCGICEKLLSQKINFLGNSISSSEFSVVAVLVCGHVYHANCLEQRTRFDDLRDPPCPLCAALLLQHHHNHTSNIITLMACQIFQLLVHPQSSLSQSTSLIPKYPYDTSFTRSNDLQQKELKTSLLSEQKKESDLHLEALPRKGGRLESLESIIRIKEAEARMFQSKADEARREAEGFQKMIKTKAAQMEEEYAERLVEENGSNINGSNSCTFCSCLIFFSLERREVTRASLPGT